MDTSSLKNLWVFTSCNECTLVVLSKIHNDGTVLEF